MSDEARRQANDPNALAWYWSGIHDALNGRLKSVQRYLRHHSSGSNAENYFRDLLRQYIPRRFAVETGFVVNTDGERSDLLDVLIVDSLHIPPLSAEPHFKTFPAEAVIGVIEITSAPGTKVRRSGIAEKISKLEDDILKIAKLRKIAEHRHYLQSVPHVAVARSRGPTTSDEKGSRSRGPLRIRGRKAGQRGANLERLAEGH